MITPPIIKAIQKKLRYVFEHQDEVEEKKELALITAIKFTWRESARKVLDTL